MTSPIVITNERPAEEEGALKKCLSLAIAALNLVATIIGTCVQ
jgi:hypothetical protein